RPAGSSSASRRSGRAATCRKSRTSWNASRPAASRWPISTSPARPRACNTPAIGRRRKGGGSSYELCRAHGARASSPPSQGERESSHLPLRRLQDRRQARDLALDQRGKRGRAAPALVGDLGAQVEDARTYPAVGEG